MTHYARGRVGSPRTRGGSSAVAAAAGGMATSNAVRGRAARRQVRVEEEEWDGFHQRCPA